MDTFNDQFLNTIVYLQVFSMSITGSEGTCNDNLISGSRGIPDNQLTATSTPFPTCCGPECSRINPSPYFTGCPLQEPIGWVTRSKANEYLQAQFDAKSVVTGVMTQGRRFYAGESDPIYYQWVTKYKVFHGNGVTFSPVFNKNGDQEFSGNSDRDSIVTNMFYEAVRALFIRIQPTSWTPINDFALRWELTGCKDYPMDCKTRSKIKCASDCLEKERCGSFLYRGRKYEYKKASSCNSNVACIRSLKFEIV